MYKAIYRKYRPKKFEDLIGQDHITTILQNQIYSNSISHAYLFSGTRGTGKTSCAKIFARAINCLDENEKPCNKCENCLESLDESSIDIIEIDAASNNSVDNIRDLKDRAFYQPTSLKYKVYIIDEVHMLSKSAFNALLKILEEPPSYLVFILATTEPEKIPLTILSRCQKFQFKRITKDQMVESLKKIASLEDIKIDNETYNLILNSADGSMRDAQSILEQLVSSGEKVISYEYASNVLGVVNKTNVFEIIDAILNNKPSDLLESIDDSLITGKDTEQLGKDILDHFRNIMIAKISNNSIDRFISSNQEVYIENSKKIELDKILMAMDMLIKQLNEIKYSQQKRALLEIVLLEILGKIHSTNKNDIRNNVNNNIKTSHEENKNIKIDYTNEYIDKENKTEEIKETISMEEKIETKASDKESISTGANNENIAEINDENNESTNVAKLTSQLTLEELQKDWKEILQVIKNSKKKMLHAFLVESSVLDFKNDTIVLGFHSDYSFHKNNIRKKGNREFVEKEISLFYNENVKINAKFINEEDNQEIDKDIDTLTKLVGKENIKIL